MYNSDKIMAVSGAVIFVLAVALTFIIGGTPSAGDGTHDDSHGPPDWDMDYTLKTGEVTGGGHAEESTTVQETFDITVNNVRSVTVTLTWTDEPDQTILFRKYTNAPDEFGMTLAGPNGTLKASAPKTSNPGGGEGSITCTLEFQPDSDPYTNGTGTYGLTVECGNCGDQAPRFGLIGFEDTGNDYSFVVEYEYYVMNSGEGA